MKRLHEGSEIVYTGTAGALKALIAREGKRIKWNARGEQKDSTPVEVALKDDDGGEVVQSPDGMTDFGSITETVIKPFRSFVTEASDRKCLACGEPEEGEFGWFDHDTDGLVCNRCGADPLKKTKKKVEEDGAGGGAGGGAGAGGGVPANNAGSGNIAGLGVNKAGKPANWGEPGVNLRKRHLGEVDDTTRTAYDDNSPVVDGSTRELDVAHPEPDYQSHTDDELDVWLRTHGHPKQADWDDASQPETQREGQSDFDYSNDVIKELVSEGVDVTPADTFAGAPVFEVDMDKVMKSRFGKNRYHRYSRYVGEDEVGEAIRQHGRSRKSGDIILKDSKTAVMTYLRRKPQVG